MKRRTGVDSYSSFKNVLFVSLSITLNRELLNDNNCQMKMNLIKEKIILILLFHLVCTFTFCQAPLQGNTETGRIKIQDKKGNLILGIDYQNKCVIDYVETLGRKVVSNQKGVFSSIKINGLSYTSGAGIQSPSVKVEGDRVTISKIIFGAPGNEVSEKWIFNSNDEYVDWTIERTYGENTTLEDTGFPEWSFNGMDTWTGALTGTGGVAWCRFFDRTDASLGNHTGKVTFWNQYDKACLRIDPVFSDGQHIAVRFSRQPDNRFTLNYYVTEDELRTRHFLSRFIIDRQDIWDDFDARGTVTVTYRLGALNYDKEYSRGDFKGFSNESVRSVLNTIARVGVIDEKLMGSNNWHLDMGFVCLHEQWIAQMGLAIDDADYFRNYRKTLDYFRDNAIAQDGNVKDRWAYRIWDSAPGTFENGFYECQWGDLLDANTDYVINVAELFQLNGDTKWVREHKLKCEKALDYLLARDSDGNGLIEVFTSSHSEKKGSDWIDVIWASWESAFINAKLYYALVQWADIEELTGDMPKAEYYRSMAGKCKYRFNQPLANGGFWSMDNNWYVYWRDRDGSVHGDNLVTPVNFMAIAYGICDDKARQAAILGRIESLMLKENLFMWPISFFPYKPDEGYKVNYPFPNYENGDIFLAWGEVAIRAYRNYDPLIPVKYIKNVLKQYEKDGLAFQRYRRGTTEGAGDDILANNCLPVVGLYRDIYGIEPRFDRLYLEPHLTGELNGTEIRYRLRGQDYFIRLSVNDYSISSNSFTVRSSSNFSMNTEQNKLSWFSGLSQSPSFVLTRNSQTGLRIEIVKWETDGRPSLCWKAIAVTEPAVTEYNIYLNSPDKQYEIVRNGKVYKTETSDSKGNVHFSCIADPDIENIYEIRQPE
jgi:hypothetical protein